jgi:predicted PurR-regulated permease PerM
VSSISGGAFSAAWAGETIMSSRDDGQTETNGLDVRFALQAAIIGIFVLLFFGFLSVASVILIPIVSAVLIGTVLAPLSKYTEHIHVPRLVFATAIVVIFLAAVYAGLLILSEPLLEVAKDAPRIGNAIERRFQELRDNVGAIRYLETFASEGARLNVDFVSHVKPVLAFLTPAVGQLVVFFATLFLFLLDHSELRRRLILARSTHGGRLRTMRMLRDVNDNLVRYLGTVTVINAGLGLTTGMGLYLLEFPNPLFWGTAAFICNFVPYIGSAVVAISLLFVGLVAFPTIGYAVLVTGLFLVLTTIEGHIITPNIVGHNFRTNVLVVFLSLSFWTWLWGPVGAFLSIPMLIIASVVIRHVVSAKKGSLPA